MSNIADNIMKYKKNKKIRNENNDNFYDNARHTTKTKKIEIAPNVEDPNIFPTLDDDINTVVNTNWDGNMIMEHLREGTFTNNNIKIYQYEEEQEETYEIVVYVDRSVLYDDLLCNE